MSHEYPATEIPGTPLWSENYAFGVGSDEPRIAMMFSSGRWYADPTVWREVVVVALPGGRVVHLRNYGRGVHPDGPGASLTRLAAVVPEKELHFTMDAPVHESSIDTFLNHGDEATSAAKRCRIDLRFEATQPLWDMRGDSVEAQTVAGSLHTEQIGAVSGWIEYDGDRFEIVNGYSGRDHSQGSRDLTPYLRHCWTNGEFQDGRAFHLYAMQLKDAGADFMANAVVKSATSGWLPATVTSIEFLRSAATRNEPYRIVLSSELGDWTVEAEEVLATVPLTMTIPYDMSVGTPAVPGSAMLFDQFLRLRCDGVAGRSMADRGLLVESVDQVAT